MDIKAIMQNSDFKINDNDADLILNYKEIFENLPKFMFTHFLLLLHIYRTMKTHDNELNKDIIKNQKKGMPEIKKQSIKYAEKLQSLLQYKGLMTENSVILFDLLDDLIKQTDNFFLEYNPPTKKPLRDFFKNPCFNGKRKLIKNFIDSLDY